MAQFYGDEFFGVQIDNGSHTDVIGGPSWFGWLGELGSDLIVKPSPPAANRAVRTFATGWVNDIYSGVYGPTNPGYGIYGNPNDGTYVANQSMVMGQAGAATLPSPPPVDIAQYAGTWFEQGSVKQFFSIGLVNTKAVYARSPTARSRWRTPATTSAPTGRPRTITGSAVVVNSPPTPGSTSASSSASPVTAGRATTGSWTTPRITAGPSSATPVAGRASSSPATRPSRRGVRRIGGAQQLGVTGRITPTAQFPTTVAV